jgi:Holliday junction DNA helicase RuvB
MFECIIGHDNTKKQIQIAIESARKRNENIPHTLFSGVAGCGKTTMAMETAKVAGVDVIPASPDDFTDRDATLKLLDKLSHDNYDESGNRLGEIQPTILFIDEIHRLPARGQEILGIAMEKFLLDTGKPNKFYWIPYFTIIGATTDDGRLTKPFREKFRMRFLFETYSLTEITDIIRVYSNSLKILTTDKACRTLARRSRGIPRTAKGFLESARDYAIHLGAKVITSNSVKDNFKIIGVDSKGLTKPEITILKALYKTSSPIGLDNLAIIGNESVNNVKNTIEPYLIQLGLIIRSGKGRILTDEGRRHLEEDGYLGAKRNKAEITADYVRK